MPEDLFIDKSNPLLPTEDYAELRKKGLQQIEQLASTIWTDYNASDPGITILEAVCYAITDLGYRTGFDIKDLLAPEHLTGDTWKEIFYTARQILHNNPLTLNDYRKLIIDVEGVRNAWIEPAKDYEVPIWVNYNFMERREDSDCCCEDKAEKTCFGKLATRPVSQEEKAKDTGEFIAGINKKLEENTAARADIDQKITAVKAKMATATGDDLLLLQEQLQKLESAKQQLEKEKASLDKDRNAAETAGFIEPKIVELEGLYKVLVELEQDIIEKNQNEKVLQQVERRLQQHRNLCEDFLSVTEVDYVDFGIGASVVLEEYADPDLVLAQIFFTIYKYFTPAVLFYTIEQLLAKGYLIDEIFEGPGLKHGFIDTAELEKTELYRDIRLSDIINEVADIKGIKAITHLYIPFHDFASSAAAKAYFNKWVQYLKEQQKIARVQPSQSKIIFCKERQMITYYTGASSDRLPQRMLKLFRDMTTQEQQHKLHGHQDDFEVPLGEYMELEDYFPVTYSLPKVYGVSDRFGLPAEASPTRKIQAWQLKGYLLFFEQLLVNHLSQLNHLRDLFSFDDTQASTYFSRAVTELEDLHKLLVNHGDPSLPPAQVVRNFSILMYQLVETTASFHKRRNKFLDHLLARFSEDLHEYEAISQWLTPQKLQQRMIGDKINLLKNGEYYKISSNRARACDYSSGEFWDNYNISGAERRVSRLLGFHEVKRRSLVPRFISIEPSMQTRNGVPEREKDGSGIPLNRVSIIDPRNNKVLLNGVPVREGCCTDELVSEILRYADQRKYFVFYDRTHKNSRGGHRGAGYSFALFDNPDPEKETTTLLGKSASFESGKEMEQAFDRLTELLKEINANEGFHLVEHILLRPRIDIELNEKGVETEAALLDICLDACDIGIGLDEATEVPKYSKKITRVPNEKCYDRMPWILEYFRKPPLAGYEGNMLFAVVKPAHEPVPLKFYRYELMAKRIRELQHFGSERINYLPVSNGRGGNDEKYSLRILDDRADTLAQTPFVFAKADLETEIKELMQYFGFSLDLYCAANPCDNNEDPYSFRATAIFPCWPHRFRDLTFRGLVEKTIEREFPAHIHTRVVWVGIQQMQLFESVYEAWLGESMIPPYEILNPLVDVLDHLQPCGCCRDDCGHEKSNV